MSRLTLLVVFAACANPPLDAAVQADRLAGFGAQEGCACRYVSNQAVADCVRFAQSPIPGLPATDVQFDDDAGVTQATVGTQTRRARFQGPREGCQLMSADAGR